MTNYDLIAKEYLQGQEEFYKDREDITRKLILEPIYHLGTNSRIMELGCGNGNLRYELVRKRFCGEYIGIDKSNEMLPEDRFGSVSAVIKGHSDLDNYTNRLYSRFYALDFDNELPFRDGDFNMVVSRYALHYSQNLTGLFKEIKRLLVPKGKVAAVVAHPLSEFELKRTKNYWEREQVELELFQGRVRVVHHTSYTFRDYWEAFEKNKFRVIKQDEGPIEYSETGLKVPDYYFFVLEKQE